MTLYWLSYKISVIYKEFSVKNYHSCYTRRESIIPKLFDQ